MKREILRAVRVVVALVLVITLMVGCSGPEEKKLKFLNKGKELYEKGKYTEAKLEFKNAIQIDSKYAEAHYMLGIAEMKTGNPRPAYVLFQKNSIGGSQISRFHFRHAQHVIGFDVLGVDLYGILELELCLRVLPLLVELFSLVQEFQLLLLRPAAADHQGNNQDQGHNHPHCS